MTIDQTPDSAVIDRAARLLGAADALLIGAGAGMGVDSGLPDFRGSEGFWEAYPPFRKLGLSFIDLANPAWFERDPALAWGFYGHRLQLYRSTPPHRGFAILQQLADSMAHGAFVFTSNVDGQFQQAGFDAARIVECHGSIHHLQCSQPCGEQLTPAAAISLDIDPQHCRALPQQLPRCSRCDAVARPNILMFGDGCWLPHRTDLQHQRLHGWLSAMPRDARLVKIELGAGTAIATVRHVLAQQPGPLIRINPREAATEGADIGIGCGAVAALTAIARAAGLTAD